MENTQIMTQTQVAPMDKKLIKSSGLHESQIAMLTQPTPEHLIQEREGRGGNIFHYLPHEIVTRILNNAFGFDWDNEIKQYGILEGVECWVLLKLTITKPNGDTISKEQFGQQDFLKNSNGQVIMSTGDCLKGAVSDALCKCASLLGVALDLYGKTGKQPRHNGYNGHNGHETANQNHSKTEIKRLIDGTKGMLMQNGEDAFRYFIHSLNNANTPKELATLKQYVESFVDNRIV